MRPAVSRRSHALRLAAAAACLGLGVTAVDAAANPAAHRAALRFGAPVKLTRFSSCGGYEPGVLVDRYGNVVVTAHKQNHCDGAAADPQGEVPARAMSWLWLSTDGKHFRDMPGTVVAGHDDIDRMDVGDEGHLVQDDRGNIFFADLKVADDTFVSWHATGRGKITQTAHQPVLGTAQALDDRPWLAAHGNGVVLFASNSGESAVYSSPQNGGKGRYTIYMSYDGGQTFDHLGVTIPNSGWCYPAADHRRGSKYLYVTCTDDNSKLFAYVSADNGHHWSSHYIGAFRDDNWPVSAVGPDGTVYMLHVDQDVRNKFHLYLYRSRTHGRTWQRWDATPQAGAFDDIAGPAWIDIARNGTIGVDYYLLPTQSSTWHVYAATTPRWRGAWRVADVSGKAIPGSTSTYSPWGDFLSCAFGPDNRLHVVWTVPAGVGDPGTAGAGLNSDIYYAEQLPARH
jgi:hypothetical protein